MGDYIYPECPNCEEKPSGGDGVGLSEMPRFEWTCPNCRHRHRGFFHLATTTVEWLDSRPPKEGVLSRLSTVVRGDNQ